MHPHRTIDRRKLLQLGCASGAGLLLAPAQACEFYAAHLRITHPWTRATAPGASEAVVCMKFDEVARSDRLVRASTPVASGAALGGIGAAPVLDFAIPAGRETLLAETATYLLLTGLQLPLEVARQYPLTLEFASGAVVEATLSVDYTRFL